METFGLALIRDSIRGSVLRIFLYSASIYSCFNAAGTYLPDSSVCSQRSLLLIILSVYSQYGWVSSVLTTTWYIVLAGSTSILPVYSNHDLFSSIFSSVSVKNLFYPERQETYFFRECIFVCDRFHSAGHKSTYSNLDLTQRFVIHELITFTPQATN